MNEQYQYVLYTDASTKAIDSVLMQIQEEIEKLCIFVSHALSEQPLSNYGIGTVQILPLRQAYITLFVGKTIYRLN